MQILAGEKKVDYTYVVVDVRNPQVMALSNVDGALLFGYTTAHDSTYLLTPLSQKYDKVFLFCYTGHSQQIVAKKAEDMGLKNIFGIKGGFMGIQNALGGREGVVIKDPKTPFEHLK